MAAIPEYTRRAIKNYNDKFDRVAVNLPKGSKERIKNLTKESCNAYISKLVLADLERLEHATKEEPVREEVRDETERPKEEAAKLQQKTEPWQKAETVEERLTPSEDTYFVNLNKNIKEIDIPAFLKEYKSTEEK